MRQPSAGVVGKPTVTTLGQAGELQLTCSSLGASIVSLRVPFEAGFVDAVLGYPDVADYLHDEYYMGAMCGRYAGRIQQAKFHLNGETYSIAKAATARHALHGGTHGFNTRQWTLVETGNTSSIAYALHSPDGDQGFPGDLDVVVTYTLRKNHQLVIDVEASTSRDTVLNLVNHAYFNLNLRNEPFDSSRVEREAVDNHTVTIFADAVTELNGEGIPTGKLLKIADTEFDVGPNIAVGGSFSTRSNQPLGSQAFDQNFVLNKQSAAPELAAVVRVSEHPVALAVHTTLPGLQFYTGDQLAGALGPRAGLCLEAQQFPDSPNQASFPETVLRAGETFRSKTVYAFGPLSDVLSLT